MIAKTFSLAMMIKYVGRWVCLIGMFLIEQVCNVMMKDLTPCCLTQCYDERPDPMLLDPMLLCMLLML